MSAVQRKALGQFWTPPVVAEFMFEMTGFDPTWTVIDPACGEGIFLLKALERGCSLAVGVDIDAAVIEHAATMLSHYGDRVKLICQDALLEIDGIIEGSFDLVIGNPPFSVSASIRSPHILSRFELARREKTSQYTLFEVPKFRPFVPAVVLFLERFIQLCKTNGKVCVILPDGIFSNHTYRYVREWLITNFTIVAIVGLPRDTFRAAGTGAKASILYLQKQQPKDDHQVVLASVDRIDVSEDATLASNPQLCAILEALKDV